MPRTELRSASAASPLLWTPLLLALATCSAARAATPEINYMLQCRGCHLADGAGTPDAVPALKNSVGRFLSVPGGRAYLVRVPGSAQSALDDAELAALLNWIIRAFGPAGVAGDFVPFSAQEVARVRRPPLTDVEAVRRELMRQIDRAQVP